MRAENKKLVDFIVNRSVTFKIPVYQRNYDWKVENCKQLFLDILKVIEDEKSHFIGTVCDKKEGRENCIVIDGQQRITTLMLLLKAISDNYNEYKIKDMIKEYLYNKYGDVKNGLRLQLIEGDNEIYEKIIKNDYNERNVKNAKELLDKNFTAFEKLSNLYINYLYFREKIEEYKDKITASELFSAIDNLEIVEISLDEENPQVIFESLNSTGLSLSELDLVRNYLLMSLKYKEQERLFRNYWKPIEEEVTREELENFLISTLMIQTGQDAISKNGKKYKINKNNLYTVFKILYPCSELKDIEKIEDFLKGLKYYSKYYKKCNLYDKEYLELSEIEKKIYEIICVLEVNSARPLIMYLYHLEGINRINYGTINNVLDFVLSYIVRCKVCERTGTLTQFFALMVGKLEDLKDYNNFEESFLKILTAGIGGYSCPTNEEFRNYLSSDSFLEKYKNNFIIYIYMKIENKYRNNKNNVLSFEDSYKLECICPKNIKEGSYWFDYLNKNLEFADYKYSIRSKIGNATIVENNIDITSQMDFASKRYALDSSNLGLNKYITSAVNWGKEKVEKRSNNLVEQCVKIWNIDEKYIKANKGQDVGIGIRYTLNSDFDIFTGTKVDLIYMNNKEYIVNSWRQMLEKVMTCLFEQNKNLFYKYYLESKRIKNSVAKSNIVMDKNKFREFKEIRDLENNRIYYINVGKSAYRTLTFIKEIMSFYDRNLGTNYERTVYFTLGKI